MIAIGPSPPPSSLAGRSVGRSLLAQKSAPIDGSVGECERRNNGKKQCRMQTDRKTHSATHSNDGGEKARRRLTTSPLLFSFRVRRRCCCCRFRGSFFSPPSLPRISTFVRRLANPFFPRRRTLIGRGARSLPGLPTALHGPQRRSGQKRRKVRSPVALLPPSCFLVLPSSPSLPPSRPDR